MMTMTPRDHGLPYHAYRRSQMTALAQLDQAMASVSHVGLSAPTGSGKSLIGATLSVKAMNGHGRACMLTATKALEDQYVSDLALPSLAHIRGRSNYRCANHKNCHLGRLNRCSLQRSDQATGKTNCPYIRDYLHACASQWAISNYRYFIDVNRYGQGLGFFDLLVCDEGDEAFDILSDCATIDYGWRERRRCEITPPGTIDSLDEWRDWAAREVVQARAALQASVSAGRISPSSLDESENYIRKIEAIASTSDDPDNWAIDEDESSHSVIFSPVDVSKFSGWLLDHCLQSVFMSASITPYILELLGLTSAKGHKVKFLSVDSEFPPERSPIYCIPRVQMRHTMTRDQELVWLSLIDKIIRPRLDRKGVIHTVSYARAAKIVAASKYSGHMITHGRGGVARAVESFRRSSAPCILVSPVVDTGFNFPGDECDYQIISKLPFMDSRGRENLNTLRSKRVPLWKEYNVARKLVQMCGRATRAGDDASESFIVDKQALWFVNNHGRRLFPKYWMDRYSVVDGMLPTPIEL
jgi:Rad3-related DNA helicase